MVYFKAIEIKLVRFESFWNPIFIRKEKKKDSLSSHLLKDFFEKEAGAGSGIGAFFKKCLQFIKNKFGGARDNPTFG